MKPRSFVGRLVRFGFRREHRGGSYVGLVRAADAARRRLVVQRFSDPFARTDSTRYQGERVRLTREELPTVEVWWHRRLVPLADWSPEEWAPIVRPTEPKRRRGARK